MLPTEILNSKSLPWSNVVPRNIVKAPRLRDATLALSSRRAWGAAVFLAGAAILTARDLQAQDTKRDRRPAEQAISVITNAPQSQAPPAKAATASELPHRTLDVKVINARTGRPEPGVTIKFSIGMKKEGTSDKDGRYRVTGTAREFTVLQIQIEKPGFVPLRVMWDNASAEIPVEIPREYTFTLEPGLHDRRHRPRRAGTTSRGGHGSPIDPLHWKSGGRQGESHP